jgi:hypothetical protein
MTRPRRHAIPTTTIFCAFVLAGAAVGGCRGARTRDVAGDRRTQPTELDAASASTASAHAPRIGANPDLRGKKPRVFTRASTHALALDKTNVYFGDSEDDGIFAMAKEGGTPLKLARHAPVAGAIALDGESVMWIASPGDAVLKIAVHGGGQPTTLRDRGIFSDVATSGGDVFITEAIGAGGALLRVTGATAARLAAFDGPPRAVMADASYAYVITPTKIFRTAHVRAELETIATGTGLAHATMDDKSIYFVAEVEHTPALVRIPKSGGPMATLVPQVRSAPIGVAGDEVLYFESTRSQLRAVKSDGSGEPRVVSDDETLTSPTAIESDDTTIYVASGAHETGVIVAIARQ